MAKKAIEVRLVKVEPVVVRGQGLKRAAKAAPAKKAANAHQGTHTARGNTTVYAVGQPASRTTKLSRDTLELIAASFQRA